MKVQAQDTKDGWRKKLHNDNAPINTHTLPLGVVLRCCPCGGRHEMYVISSGSAAGGGNVILCRWLGKNWTEGEEGTRCQSNNMCTPPSRAVGMENIRLAFRPLMSASPEHFTPQCRHEWMTVLNSSKGDDHIFSNTISGVVKEGSCLKNSLNFHFVPLYYRVSEGRKVLRMIIIKFKENP